MQLSGGIAMQHKKIITSIALLTIASSALAQDRGRRDRVRERNRDMNICSEIREDMEVAKLNFEEYNSRLLSIESTISNMSRNISTRTNALESRRRDASAAEARYNSLKNKQDNKVELIRTNQTNLDNASSALPGVEAKVAEAQRKKDKECGFFGGTFDRKCRKAKKALKAVKKERDALNSTIRTAQAALNELNNIDRLVRDAGRVLSNAQAAYNSEQTRTPSIADLSTELRGLRDQRRDLDLGIEAVEEEYYKAELKLEKCRSMRYEARKAPIFKEYVIKYLDGTCNEYEMDMRRVRRDVVRDGIREAHEIVCQSDSLGE